MLKYSIELYFRKVVFFVQDWSTVSIRIENPVLAKIVKKYKTLGFKTKAASLSFLDDDGEECVQYESVPGKIEDIPGCIAEGFQAECDDEGASAFEKECAAHKQEILEAYETVYWNYSIEYPLEEPIEDHVDRSYFDKFRADFAAQRHITVEEVDEEEFQAFLDAAMRIRCDETFHFRKEKTHDVQEFDCEYNITA